MQWPLFCRSSVTPVNVVKGMLTPDGDVDAEVGLAEGVLRLARVPAGVVGHRVEDAQLRCDAVQLPDLGRARLARHGQVVATVLAPLNAVPWNIQSFRLSAKSLISLHTLSPKDAT